MMGKKGSILLICMIVLVAALAALLVTATGAQASPSFTGAFLDQYPQAGPTLTAAANDCSLCHSSIPARNSYGTDLEPASNSTIGFRLIAVELLNSDGDADGAANDCDNITEINNDKLPGDAASTPANCGAANNPPVADPNGPYNGTVDSPVQFDGSGSTDEGTIVSYAWDFGDGGTGTGVSPTHAYAAAGTYTVTLTVEDDGGLTDTATTSTTIRNGIVNQEDVEAEIEVPETIKPGKRGRNPVKIKIDFDEDDSDDVAMLNSVRCGPERLGPVAEPKRINREENDENEFVAHFNVKDLRIERGDLQIMCEGEGTLEDRTMFTFAGTSNKFKMVGQASDDKDDDDENKDENRRHNENRRRRDKDDDD